MRAFPFLLRKLPVTVLAVAWLLQATGTRAAEPRPASPPPAASPAASPGPTAGAVAGAGAAKLAARYRSFLEDDTSYLLSDVERLAFLDLVDDRQRDAFVQGFWLARDPSPGTYRNEFKVDHMQRVAEADQLFGASRARPGWKTARGRIHILLGPPRDRIVYGSEAGLRAVEDWLYEAAPTDGGPRFFHVLFYRPGPGEDDALYDPTSDGPEKLLATAEAASKGADALAARAESLSRLSAVSRELAAVSLSLVPTDPGDLEKGVAAASSGKVVDRLLDLANRRVVSLSYLDALAAGRPGGKGALAYGSRFALEGLFHGDFAGDAGGAGVAHEAVLFPPEALSYRRMGERLLGALHIAGRVSPADDPATVVLAIDEQVDLSLAPADHEQLKSHPLAFEDLLPLLPGTYNVRLVARNLLTREVGIAEGRVEVPAPPERDAIALSALLPVVDSLDVPAAKGEVRPFFFGTRRVFPLSGEVAPRGELECVFHLAYPVSRHAPGEEYVVRYALVDATGDERLAGFGRLRVDPTADGGYAPGSIAASLQGLTPGEYKLRVQVSGSAAKGGAGEVATREVGFRVGESQTPSFNPPWIYARKRSLAPADLAHATYAQRLLKNDVTAAIRALESAMDDPTVGAEARLLLADLHLARAENGEAEAAVKPLAARGIDPSARVQALLRIGVARTAAGNDSGALSALDEALRESPRHVRLWNALASTCLKLGDAARAKEAYERSLALDPGQPEVTSALRTLSRARR